VLKKRETNRRDTGCGFLQKGRKEERDRQSQWGAAEKKHRGGNFKKKEGVGIEEEK